MNWQDVQEQARAKWGAHGAWVAEQEIEVITRDRGGVEHKRRTWDRCIGICRPDGKGLVDRVVIGRAETWEEAMVKAEDWWSRQVPRKFHHSTQQERAEKAGGFPMAGDLLDGPA